MRDGFNRKITYARISLTSSCNLDCLYCSPSHKCENSLSVDFYKKLIDALVLVGIEKIRFTGGEPLLNKDIIELIKYAKNKKEITDIAITTNGVLFDKYCELLIGSGLNRINFSIDTFNKDTFNKLTGKNRYSQVIENILLAKKRGLIVKINAVLLKGITDVEIDKFFDFGKSNDIQIRFIELMPIGNNIEYYEEMYLSQKDFLSKFDYKLADCQNSDVSTYYEHKGYVFGIISAISNHFCNECNRIRITSRGGLRLCLHSDDEISLKECRNDNEMYLLLKNSIREKPEKHEIDKQNYAKGNMAQIGG